MKLRVRAPLSPTADLCEEFRSHLRGRLGNGRRQPHASREAVTLDPVKHQARRKLIQRACQLHRLRNAEGMAGLRKEL